MSDYGTKLKSLTDEERKEFHDFAVPIMIASYFNPYGPSEYDQRAVGSKLDEILAKRTPPQPVFDWWKPEIMREYWRTCGDGSLSIARWDGEDIHVDRRDAGNVFPTREAAEAESLRTTARRFYENACRIANGGGLWPDTTACTGFEAAYIPANDSIGYASSSVGFLRRTGVPFVADSDTALSIRAAMQEKGLLQHYFGE